MSTPPRPNRQPQPPDTPEGAIQFQMIQILVRLDRMEPHLKSIAESLAKIANK